MHLTHIFPRFKALTGGETVILQLTRELAKLGVESTIITRGYNSQCDVLLDPEVELRVIRSPLNWLSGNHFTDSFLDVWFAPFLLSLIPLKTDGIIFHSEASPFALWWWKRWRSRAEKVVYFCYQPPRFAYDLLPETASNRSPVMWILPIYAWLHRILDRKWVQRADEIWAFSKVYAEWCKVLYQRDHVDAFPLGVNMDRFSKGDPDYLRQTYRIPDDHILLLTVNKLIPRKNIDVFIRVVEHLNATGCPATGVIVGDGPERNRLEIFAKETGAAKNIIFSGHIVEKLADYYAGADVLLFLEKNVPFGLTPLEAGIAGIPAIAPKGGGAMETILHDKTGFHVDENLNVAEISSRVRLFSENPTKRAKFGAAARSHARTFSWERFAYQVLSRFEPRSY